MMKKVNKKKKLWASLLSLAFIIYAAGPSAGLAKDHKSLKKCSHMKKYEGSDRNIEILIDKNYKVKVHLADEHKPIWNKDSLTWKLVQTPEGKRDRKIKSYEVQFVKKSKNCEATVPKGKELWPCEDSFWRTGKIWYWKNGGEDKSNSRKQLSCEIREDALPGYVDNGKHGDKHKQREAGTDKFISDDKEWGYCYKVTVNFERAVSETAYGGTLCPIHTLPGGSGNGCSGCHADSSF